jgi:endoglucanase
MQVSPRTFLTPSLLALFFLACSGEGGKKAGDGNSLEMGSSGGAGGECLTACGASSGSGGTDTSSGGTDGMPIAGDPFAVFYRGANLSGAEHGIENDGTEIWGNATPGAEGAQYAWPDPGTNPEVDEIDIFLSRGMNFYRLPIAWERIQQSLYGPLDVGYLNRLHNTVDAIRSRGATVMIDIHNYARYKPQDAADASPSPVIGSPDLPTDALADLWGKLAAEFGETSRTSPIWFDIMNEPYDIDAVVWASAANQAITAIRDSGALNVILVPPVQWGTAWDFSWHEGMQNHTQDIVDPLDNYAVQVHQYSHGAGPDCTTDEDDFVTLVGPAEQWARAHGRRLFLGEFNASQNDACLPAVDKLLTHLESHRVGQPDGIWVGFSVWAINARGTWKELDNDDGPEGHMTETIVSHLPSTCGDNMVSGDETGADCGGSCRRCAAESACATGNDCQSGLCAGGICK